ncbi:MAG: S-adenosylmethionine decarboxylase [Candidatus Omnitrophica bacterium]|nr:S-adenosylmethionine decarboxylase [Candidatus Omnitrophota bacterium]
MSNQKEGQDQVFGYQLLLDLYGCKEGVCDDLSLCYRFLDEIVEELGMEKQAPPNIFRSDETRFPDKAGLSGWVPLIESSTVIHTLSSKNFMTIDIYCCKNFDLQKAKDVCRRFFAPAKVDEQYIERGADYYKSDSSYHTVMVTGGATDSPEVVLSKK